MKRKNYYLRWASLLLIIRLCSVQLHSSLVTNAWPSIRNCFSFLSYGHFTILGNTETSIDTKAKKVLKINKLYNLSIYGS